MKHVLFLFILFSSFSIQSQSDTLNINDTIILSDSEQVFYINLGTVKKERISFSFNFRYTGTDSVIISRSWTTDPHYITRYPHELLVRNKTYNFTALFPFNNYYPGMRLKKQMGFFLSNGEKIVFRFLGEIESDKD